MDIKETIKKDITIVVGSIQHHLGLSFIVLAFLSLFYQSAVKGKRVNVPGHFFLIYAIGCFFLSYSMWQQQMNYTIIGLEAMLGILGLYFYFN